MLSTPPKDARRRVPVHPPLHGSPNGDEDAYPLADGRPSRLGCFGKGLEHDEQGAVVPEAYVSGELHEVWRRSRDTPRLDRKERTVLRLLET